MARVCAMLRPLGGIIAKSDWTGPAKWAVAFSAASIVIAVMTLFLTRLRPARLRLASAPPSFGTQFHPEGWFYLRLPVVVQNTGAKTGVVAGLRFKNPESWGSSEKVSFAHTQWTSINPRHEENAKFIEPIPVRGGETVVSICEFNVADVTADRISNGRHRITLEAPRRWRRWRSGWYSLGRFDLVITDVQQRGFDQANAHFNDFGQGTENVNP